MSVRIITGDSLTVLRTLESESVQCVVTSPPYAFLRSYLPADHPDKAKEIGSEPTPEAFVAALVEVFREVKRVLRRDGIAVVNLGDSYSGSGKGPSNSLQRPASCLNDRQLTNGAAPTGWQGTQYDLPPKNLLMIPFRVAMAMQADGWILRSVMPWVKRNSMPESVTDRPASAIEYLFMFARSSRYFWDSDAIRIPQSDEWIRRTKDRTVPRPPPRAGDVWGKAEHTSKVYAADPAGRSYRNSDPFFATWQGLMLDEDGDPLALVVNPQPSSLEHFASFPPGLVEPFVKAGTSQKGACPACGAPWSRTVERNGYTNGSGAGSGGFSHDRAPVTPLSREDPTKRRPARNAAFSGETTGWAPGCSCDAGDPVPCVVLDPFAGSFTTCLTADRLGRDSIGIELSEKYVELGCKRLYGDCPMFSDIEVAG